MNFIDQKDSIAVMARAAADVRRVKLPEPTSVGQSGQLILNLKVEAFAPVGY